MNDKHVVECQGTPIVEEWSTERHTQKRRYFVVSRATIGRGRGSGVGTNGLCVDQPTAKTVFRVMALCTVLLKCRRYLDVMRS